MKAAVFRKAGIENLEITEYPKPKITHNYVLIRIKTVGVNPIDYFVVSGIHGLKSGAPLRVTPMPHIPGGEISGVVEKVGAHVKRLNTDDRVVVYNRLFDGTCDLCIDGCEMICRHGGLISVVTNGGFAEYIAVPEVNVFKIPDKVSWEIAASLPISALTSFHALKQACLKLNEYLLVFGASGSTGMFAIQLGKKIGSKVIAVSKKKWIRDFGADLVIGKYDNKVIDEVKRFTQANMADVVLDPLGSKTWDKSFESVGNNGRWVTFGILTGAEVSLNLQSLYFKQIKLIGSTGGSRKEFKELVEISKDLKVKVWKKFKLHEAKEALEALFDKEREGRILLYNN